MAEIPAMVTAGASLLENIGIAVLLLLSFGVLARPAAREAGRLSPTASSVLIGLCFGVGAALAELYPLGAGTALSADAGVAILVLAGYFSGWAAAAAALLPAAGFELLVGTDAVAIELAQSVAACALGPLVARLRPHLWQGTGLVLLALLAGVLAGGGTVLTQTQAAESVPMAILALAFGINVLVAFVLGFGLVQCQRFWRMLSELRANARSLESIARNLPGTLYTRRMDRNGGVKTAFLMGRAVTRGGGVEEIEAAYGSFIERLHPDDVDGYVEGLHHSAERLEVFDTIYRLRDEDGSYRTLHSRSRPSREADGSVVWHGTVLDISARQEAEERAREAQERLRAIFDSTFQATALLTLDGEVLEVNQSALSYGGVAREEVVGRRFWDSYWWSASEGARVRLKQAVKEAAGGGMVRYEEELLGVKGQLRPTDFSLKPVLDESGKVSLLVAEGRDIKRVKAAEQDRLAQQRLLAMGQLTGGIAHEFNNLLQVAIGAAQNLGERLSNDPRARRQAEMIVLASERGASLTQRLLAFSRKQVLRPDGHRVAAVLLDFKAELEREAGSQVGCLIELPDGGLTVRVDRQALRNALLALVENAVQASEPGSHVVVSARPGVGLEGRLGFIAITVRDDGHGMSEEVRRRAVEPFFSTRKVGEGSGLGLSMAEGFARQSGGSLEIDSQPGRGTRVTLWLPTRESARGKAEAREDGASDGRVATLRASV